MARQTLGAVPVGDRDPPRTIPSDLVFTGPSSLRSGIRKPLPNRAITGEKQRLLAEHHRPQSRRGTRDQPGASHREIGEPRGNRPYKGDTWVDQRLPCRALSRLESGVGDGIAGQCTELVCFAPSGHVPIRMGGASARWCSARSVENQEDRRNGSGGLPSYWSLWQRAERDPA